MFERFVLKTSYEDRDTYCMSLNSTINFLVESLNQMFVLNKMNIEQDMIMSSFVSQLNNNQIDVLSYLETCLYYLLMMSQIPVIIQMNTLPTVLI